MSTIALFGGSGRTGKRILQSLLEKGHDVRILSRHPIHEHENMVELIGDATNPELVRERKQQNGNFHLTNNKVHG